LCMCVRLRMHGGRKYLTELTDSIQAQQLAQQAHHMSPPPDLL